MDLTFRDRLAEARALRAPRGRYAPSPSGSQHLGNARTALLAWLQIRLRKGTFIVRMEDLDRPRVVAGSARQLLEELEWMGIDWDEGVGAGGPSGPYEQSARERIYASALELLRQRGHLFPCVCSRRDVRLAASAPHVRTTVYPGTCRHRRPVAPGRRHAWRFRVPHETVGFVDAVNGPVRQDVVRDAGDFVLRRADGIFAYHLAVVVDDALMGISDIVRGADLLDATPQQLLLYQAIGAPPPEYWHVPLMMDGRGRRMAKRDGSQTVEAFRAAGCSAAELVGRLAASVGLVPDGTALTPAELLMRHDLESLRRQLRSFSRRQPAEAPPGADSVT